MIMRSCTIMCFWLVMMAAILKAEAGDTTSGVAHMRTDVERVLGIVESSKFVPLFPANVKRGELRLTTVQRQEARSVESGELDLSSHEGQAIMVEGTRDSGWLYDARIVDRAGPILTTVVRQTFQNRSK